MKLSLFAFAFAALSVGSACADTINYNTTGFTLSCNGIAGCVQNTTTSVTDGGLTITYNTSSGSGVNTPSIINFGNIVTTGTGSSVNFTGLQLTFNVNSTPPGASGTLPNGALLAVCRQTIRERFSISRHITPLLCLARCLGL